MSQVVLFDCGGFACAVPARQVRRIGPQTDERPLALWRGAPPQGRSALVVQTPTGPRGLACADAEFRSLGGYALLPLSELLRDALGLAHLVGIVEVEGRLVWLVDFARWEERTDEH